MTKQIKLIALSLLFASFAQSAGANPFAGVKVLKCTFAPGYNANWASGSLQLEKGKFGEPIVFHSFDFAAKSAVMTGNAFSPPVQVFTTAAGMTLLEWFDGDTVVIATVYPRKAKNGEFVAVHSRHKNLFASPIPSQFHGTCRADY